MPCALKHNLFIAHAHFHAWEPMVEIRVVLTHLIQPHSRANELTFDLLFVFLKPFDMLDSIFEINLPFFVFPQLDAFRLLRLGANETVTSQRRPQLLFLKLFVGVPQLKHIGWCDWILILYFIRQSIKLEVKLSHLIVLTFQVTVRFIKLATLFLFHNRFNYF